MSSRKMVEIRFHGRGGQGAVLSATLAAEVAFRMGYYPQAFPLFGAERRGAPVIAFLRYSSSFLMPRCRIYEPDCVVVFDPELPEEPIWEGLKKKESIMLVNAADNSRHLFRFKERGDSRLYAVDGSGIAAAAGLVSSGMPLVGSVMLGALVKVLGLASFHVLEECLQGRISQLEENVLAAGRGYDEVKEVKIEDAIIG